MTSSPWATCSCTSSEARCHGRFGAAQVKVLFQDQNIFNGDPLPWAGQRMPELSRLFHSVLHPVSKLDSLELRTYFACTHAKHSGKAWVCGAQLSHLCQPHESAIARAAAASSGYTQQENARPAWQPCTSVRNVRQLVSTRAGAGEGMRGNPLLMTKAVHTARELIVT